MKILIIGAGLAGLSAAVSLAKEDIASCLISFQVSERAQSVMAEGGINGALNTMGEDDTAEEHFRDTMKAGGYISDPEAVRGLTEAAPGILRELIALGTPFNIRGTVVQQRNFGGQKKKRTAYARSSTGKALMSTLIDEARRYEAAGLITRYPHHEFLEAVIKDGACRGCVVRDCFTGRIMEFKGPVIMACGGLNGMFPEVTTGTVGNSGSAAAALFAQGVRFSNLEMIQYHPTTIRIPGKCALVSEAARGEGGRLFVMRDGSPWHFMEEKYPELGNLMPRDVVSRESYFVTCDENCGGQVYLDMRHLPEETWKNRLPDMREEIKYYLGIDPAKEPVPVYTGIHYFMGGIDVDVHHRTNIEGLFAAGECCSQYHGANRLGGNSTMGAIYGGRVAADSAARLVREKEGLTEGGDAAAERADADVRQGANDASDHEEARYGFRLELRDIMLSGLGIVRDEETLQQARSKVISLRQKGGWNRREMERLYFAEAVLDSAIIRKESRGAHYRSDHPETSEEFAGRTAAEYRDGITVRMIRT